MVAAVDGGTDSLSHVWNRPVSCGRSADYKVAQRRSGVAEKVTGATIGRWRMSQFSERDPRALLEARYAKTQRLERQLRNAIQARGAVEANIRTLRNTIRDNYEAILLADHDFAEAREIEHALWRVHYKRIEEFRNRIRNLHVAVAPPVNGAWPVPQRGGAAAATPALRAAKGAVVPAGSSAASVAARTDTLMKVLAGFKSFLAEASGFYHDLVLKLRTKHGLPQDYLLFTTTGGGGAVVSAPGGGRGRGVGSLPFSSSGGGSGATAEECDANSAEDTEAGDAGKSKMTAVQKCLLSCHRCLIYLGDLTRYKELHSNVGLAKDYSVAAGYYLQAAALWPSSGNPHHQLAVLATYVDDELMAVYRYFRSLAVDIPFLTARENLTLLFEKNREAYAHLPKYDPMHTTAANGTARDTAGYKGSEKKDNVKVADRFLSTGEGNFKLAVKSRSEKLARQESSSDLTEAAKNFRVRFVRLQGILFSKISLETFGNVYAATMEDLERLLGMDDGKLEKVFASEHRKGTGLGSNGSVGVLKLVAILIFTVHNISWTQERHQPTYAEVLSRPTLFQHAFTAAFDCAGRLMRRCASSSEVEKSLFLPGLLVFLEWLACRSDMAIGSDGDEKQSNARVFFWRQASELLNFLLQKDDQGARDDFGTLEGQGGFFDMANRLAGMVEGMGVKEGGTALWEDYELRGFNPLLPAQLALDYSKPAPRVGSSTKEEEKVRVRRLIAAGKAAASSFQGSQNGMHFDEVREMFIIPGDEPAKDKSFAEMEQLEVTAEAEDDGVLLEQHTLSSGNTEAPEAQNSVDHGGLPSDGTEDSMGDMSGMVSGLYTAPRIHEDDEEVIVFKPAVRTPNLSVASRTVQRQPSGMQFHGARYASDVDEATKSAEEAIAPDLSKSSLSHEIGGGADGNGRFPDMPFDSRLEKTSQYAAAHEQGIPFGRFGGLGDRGGGEGGREENSGGASFASTSMGMGCNEGLSSAFGWNLGSTDSKAAAGEVTVASERMMTTTGMMGASSLNGVSVSMPPNLQEYWNGLTPSEQHEAQLRNQQQESQLDNQLHHLLFLQHQKHQQESHPLAEQSAQLLQHQHHQQLMQQQWVGGEQSLDSSINWIADHYNEQYNRYNSLEVNRDMSCVDGALHDLSMGLAAPSGPGSLLAHEPPHPCSRLTSGALAYQQANMAIGMSMPMLASTSSYLEEMLLREITANGTASAGVSTTDLPLGCDQLPLPGTNGMDANLHGRSVGSRYVPQAPVGYGRNSPVGALRTSATGLSGVNDSDGIPGIRSAAWSSGDNILSRQTPVRIPTPSPGAMEASQQQHQQQQHQQQQHQQQQHQQQQQQQCSIRDQNNVPQWTKQGQMAQSYAEEDDYAWLDEYTQSKPEMPQVTDESQAASLFSSTYGGVAMDAWKGQIMATRGLELAFSDIATVESLQQGRQHRQQEHEPSRYRARNPFVS